MIEVEFLDVLGMKIKTNYVYLIVDEAGDSPEIDEFVTIPERHELHYRKLIVSDETASGFVVCGSFRIRET